MSTSYWLYDEFNDKPVSRHRSAQHAAKAANAILRSIRRRHGQGAYLPLSLRQRCVDDGYVRFVRVDDETTDQFVEALCDEQ